MSRNGSTHPVTESTEQLHNRDPVSIVKNARLLKICGSASNAFMNSSGCRRP